MACLNIDILIGHIYILDVLQELKIITLEGMNHCIMAAVTLLTMDGQSISLWYGHMQC